jgi:predicted nucleic acid-binding protein
LPAECPFVGVADRWGRLAAQAGPKSPLPVIDGLLAATALHHNLTLVTRNTKDVARTGVPVFNPWACSSIASVTITRLGSTLP